MAGRYVSDDNLAKYTELVKEALSKKGDVVIVSDDGETSNYKASELNEIYENNPGTMFVFCGIVLSVDEPGYYFSFSVVYNSGDSLYTGIVRVNEDKSMEFDVSELEIPYSGISDKPTTLDGFGITDALGYSSTSFDGDYNRLESLDSGIYHMEGASGSFLGENTKLVYGKLVILKIDSGYSTAFCIVKVVSNASELNNAKQRMFVGLKNSSVKHYNMHEMATIWDTGYIYAGVNKYLVQVTSDDTPQGEGYITFVV